MGSHTSIQFTKYQWKPFKINKDIKIFHNGLGLYAQKYDVIQDKTIDAKEQLLIYKQRAQSSFPIVKVYNAEIFEQKYNICSVFQKIMVYTEHIPNRLSQIKSFSLSEVQALYLLSKTLEGFSQLFKKFGYFQIKQNQIGFNIEGQLKCWISEKFQKNKAQNLNKSIIGQNENYSQNNLSGFDYKLRQSIQKGMIADLWEIIKKKSNIQNYELFQRLSNLQSLNFQNAQKLVQYLIVNSHLKIPECLYFENCIQNLQHRYRQFSYGGINEELSNHKPVETMQSGIAQLIGLQPIFKQFNKYRQFIDNLQSKKEIYPNQSKICIKTKDINPQNPDIKSQKTLKLISNTSDISLSTIPKTQSSKTITQNSEFNTLKKLESDPYIPICTQKQKEHSVLIPNAVSERFILTDVLNTPHSRVIYGNPSNFKDNQKLIQNSRVLMKSPQKFQSRRYVPIYQQSVLYPPIPTIKRNLSSRNFTTGELIRNDNWRDEPQTPKFDRN